VLTTYGTLASEHASHLAAEAHNTLAAAKPKAGLAKAFAASASSSVGRRPSPPLLATT